MGLSAGLRLMVPTRVLCSTGCRKGYFKGYFKGYLKGLGIWEVFVCRAHGSK